MNLLQINAHFRLLTTNLDPPHACISLIVALTFNASSFLLMANMGMTIGSKAGICILGIPERKKLTQHLFTELKVSTYFVKLNFIPYKIIV